MLHDKMYSNSQGYFASGEKDPLPLTKHTELLRERFGKDCGSPGTVNVCTADSETFIPRTQPFTVSTGC